MADLVARIDGLYDLSCVHACTRLPSQLMGSFPSLSTVICALGISECGIHAVCIPLDELFVDEGD